MTTEEFIAWSCDRPPPGGKRFELDDGEMYEMGPERSIHVQVKANIYFQLRLAIEAAGLSCDVYADGMAVRVDDATVYEPDAALRTGPPLDPEALIYDDPVIVVEVLSPSTQSLDVGQKLAGYFTLPSLRHYLIVRPDKPTVTHHARTADGTIRTRIATDGQIDLDPLGLMLDVKSLFPTART